VSGTHFSGGGGGGAPESHASQHQDGGADEISIAALSGTPAALTTHEGAADPHSVYRLESADHSHQSTGLQGGTLDAAAITAGTIATARLGSGTANNTVFLRGDQTWAAPAGGSGALARAGGNTTEATTTSTSAVDLLTVATGLSVAANVPLFLRNLFRKTTGAAAAAGCGLKLNSTTVAEAESSSGSVTSVCGTCSAANQAESGEAVNWIAPIVTDYTFGASQGLYFGSNSSGSVVNFPQTVSSNGNRPNATLTDVIIRGKTGNNAITLGADEAHLYSYTVS